jgi:hypothetical protein
MPKHIRNRDNRQHRMNDCSYLSGLDYIKCEAKKIQDSYTSPKQAMGWIMAILMIIILGAVAAHYMGYITLPGPLAGIPRKAAPASHLQYFFF